MNAKTVQFMLTIQLQYLLSKHAGQNGVLNGALVGVKAVDNLRPIL